MSRNPMTVDSRARAVSASAVMPLRTPLNVRVWLVSMWSPASLVDPVMTRETNTWEVSMYWCWYRVFGLMTVLGLDLWETVRVSYMP